MPASGYNSNGTPTQATVAQAINSACASTGVSPTLMTCIAQQESGFGSAVTSLTPNSAGAVGVMQLTPITIQQLSDMGYTINPYDVNSNVTGATVYMGSLLQQFNGNQDAAIAAYFEGPTAVSNLMAEYGSDWESHLPTGGANYLSSVNQKLSTQGVSSDNPVNSQAAAANSSTPDSNPTLDPIMAVPLPQQNISLQQYQDINPPTVITNSDGTAVGLSSTPWYNDSQLLTGNPRIHKQGGFPITFQIYLDQTNSNSLLTSTGQVGGQPIVIALNCSCDKFSVASRHIMNHSQTRTAWHITMWGMAADTITGSGSTGVFMNQFGITDFLSLSGTPSDAIAEVLAAFPSGTNAVGQTAPYNTNASVISSTLSNSLSSSINSTNPAQSSANSPVQPFRIAAEDAFIEFLSLFKMNGTTWLHPSGYGFDSESQTADIQNQNQIALYSSQVGATDFEIKARNNDVYRRGYVVMSFRNSQYLGFFKQLSWALDAEKPYQWRFQFVFQVERTLSLVYFPQTTPSTTGSNTLPAATPTASTSLPTSGQLALA